MAELHTAGEGAAALVTQAALHEHGITMMQR
jgi:hypothetical protein